MTVVLKRRFKVDVDSAKCTPHEEQPPVVLSPEFGDPDSPASSPVVVPGEIASEKARVDVMVKGKAYAPGGRATPTFDASVKIAGAMNQTLRIQGDRQATFVPPKKRLTRKALEKGERQDYPMAVFGDPIPLVELELSYEFAFGGVGCLVMEEFDRELADDAHEEAELLEERRKRKKEIEEELAAEEDAEAAKATLDARRAAGEIVDDETADKVGKAFGAGGTQMLDVASMGLDDPEAPPEMEKVSAFRLGGGDAEVQAGPDDAAEVEAEEDTEESPFASGTQILDISELAAEADRDELKVALDDRALKDARKLRDKDGAYQVRATAFGDIELSDDEWIAKYGKKLKKPKRKKAEPSEHPEIPYPANPSGRGFCVSPLMDAVEGLALPNIEWPDDLLSPEALIQDMQEFDLHALRAPAGFACYPLSWYPRVKYAGVMPWDMGAAEAAKAKSLEEYDPEDPEDQAAIEAIGGLEIPVMQALYFQEAHPRMQVDRVNGDEEVLLTHLTPDGNLFFRLPGTHPRASLDLGRGEIPLTMRLDTLTFDLSQVNDPAVEMVWRAWHPLKDFSALEELLGFEVNVQEQEQGSYLDGLRVSAEESGPPREEGTTMLRAMPESDMPEPMDGEALEREYRESADGHGARSTTGAKDPGVKVFDQSLDRAEMEGEWDKEIRENKDDVDAIIAKQKADQKKAKRKALREKARVKADEEFGIDREDDE